MYYTSSGSLIGVHGYGGGVASFPGLVGQPPLESFRESIFEGQVAGHRSFVAGRQLAGNYGVRSTLNGGVPVSGSWGQHSGRLFGTGSVMGWR